MKKPFISVVITAKNGNKVIGYDKNLNLIIELQNRRLPFIEKLSQKAIQI